MAIPHPLFLVTIHLKPNFTPSTTSRLVVPLHIPQILVPLPVLFWGIAHFLCPTSYSTSLIIWVILILPSCAIKSWIDNILVRFESQAPFLSLQLPKLDERIVGLKLNSTLKKKANTLQAGLLQDTLQSGLLQVYCLLQGFMSCVAITWTKALFMSNFSYIKGLMYSFQ